MSDKSDPSQGGLIPIANKVLTTKSSALVRRGLETLASQEPRSNEYEDGLAAYKHGDYKTACARFMEAADQGYLDAQYMLGRMYDNGEGVPQDYNQAVIWYRKAADQGHASAQSKLGWMYYNGQGVPKDYVEAHKWFNLAAANTGENESRDKAIRNRDLVAQLMTPTEIAEARKRASE